MTAERDGASYPDAHLLIFNVLSRVPLDSQRGIANSCRVSSADWQALNPMSYTDNRSSIL